LNAAAQKFIDLGLYGNVSVLNPSTSSYVQQAVTIPTIWAASNCSAYQCRTNTTLSRTGYNNLLNATEIDQTIGDFTPITLHGTDGNTTVIGSHNIPRDYVMIGKFLEQRPDIVSQPKKYEWTNRMIQQMSWNIFDNQYGPGFFDNKTYTPMDQDVWKAILTFHDYMDKLPAKMQQDMISQPIAFNDAPALRQQIADYTNRTVALLNLANVAPVTKDLAANKTVNGIAGMQKFIDQLPAEYQAIVNEYKNPTMGGIGGSEYKVSDMWFAQWLQDRHGSDTIIRLPSTVNQFLGATMPGGTTDLINYINNPSGTGPVHKLLKVNPFVKTIVGYERSTTKWGSETEMMGYGYSLGFTALGIPYSPTRYDGAPIGAGGWEWSIAVPDSASIGNFFGLPYCISGLKADGVTRISQTIRQQLIDIG
jgi:hypothetical protein